MPVSKCEEARHRFVGRFLDRADGFYASRWCNVFYRCFSGIANIFLCPAQRNGGRLWWPQHGTAQSLPEEQAQCTYPCDTGRRCTSAGGVLVDTGNPVTESQQEAETAFQRSACSNQTNTLGLPTSFVSQPNTNPSSGSQNQGPQSSVFSSGTGVSGGVSASGSGGTGAAGKTHRSFVFSPSLHPFRSFARLGTFTVNSNVNCNNQANNAYLSSPFCNVFHQCIDGTRVDFRCARANNASQDLWWNQETRLCDWPCRVQCNGQIYGSSATAQQIRSESLIFFNNDCRAYPRLFKRKNK